MVTAYKISEKRIGNRVSKSNSNIFVKEQRVDGSCHNKLWLRYTLTAFERRYQVKIPSNHTLDPWYISGFTDAEGCFTIKFPKKGSVQFEFIIGLHITDSELLLDIKKYFGIGNFRLNQKTCIFSVVKLKDIVEIIIPFFDKYPLHTKKRGDYLLFKRAVELKYLNKISIEELLSIKASMNRGLSKQLKERYPLIKGVEKPNNFLDLTLDPNWVSGFVSGDGGFFVKIYSKNKEKNLYQSRLSFVISQNKKDIVLLEYFKEYFNCGNISKSKDMINYEVSSIADINDKIVPFFLKYPIRGVKESNFKKWIEVLNIIKSKKHLTVEGLERIKKIKETMNSFNIKK